MLKIRREAAQKIADRLMASEKSIDIALTHTAELLGAMSTLRIEANIAAEVGQEAIERTAQALAELVDGRRAMIAAHQDLAVVKDRVGLRTVGLGGLVDKAAEAPDLRVVAQRAA